MPKMRVVTVTEWGPDGVQVTYQVCKPVAGYSTNYTEMATPENTKEFKRLTALRVRDIIDMICKAVA
ncbi:hypothetical protein LCGC14_1925810 [marine sediment metagenome]|uniref:Uncharacterized protein n=1 Tax=marine sediment metagenome TaxID=412755 RepID=A0A0F9IMA0_9ZZZZ